MNNRNEQIGAPMLSEIISGGMARNEVPGNFGVFASIDLEIQRAQARKCMAEIDELVEITKAAADKADACTAKFSHEEALVFEQIANTKNPAEKKKLYSQIGKLEDEYESEMDKIRTDHNRKMNAESPAGRAKKEHKRGAER
jgi:hypothetical protein